MPEKGELSPHHNIKPPELALELAKKESRFFERNRFEDAFAKELIKVSLEQSQQNRKLWDQRLKERELQPGFESSNSSEDIALKLYRGNWNVSRESPAAILSGSGLRLKPVFLFQGDKLDGIAFDILYPNSKIVDRNRQEKIYQKHLLKIHKNNPEGIEKFATEGLPVVDPWSVKPSDIVQEPEVYRLYGQNLDFSGIWQRVAQQYPQGAADFMEEILTSEEDEINMMIDSERKSLKGIQALIESWEHQGQGKVLLAQLKRERSINKDRLAGDEANLKALKAYRKQFERHYLNQGNEKQPDA